MLIIRGARGMIGSLSFLRRLRFGFSMATSTSTSTVVEWSFELVPFCSVVVILVFRLRTRTVVFWGGSEEVVGSREVSERDWEGGVGGVGVESRSVRGESEALDIECSDAGV